MSDINNNTELACLVSTTLRDVSSESIALGMFSGLIANGESYLTKGAIKDLVGRGTEPQKIHEVVLQSYLFCGFPRMLDALFDLAAIVEPKDYASTTPPNCSKLAYSEAESNSYELRGRELIEKIYGKRYEKLEKAIVTMSPEAFQLMIMEGYGKTLSRPGLEIKTRELAVIAALVVDKRPRQLRAHLFGAQNVEIPIARIDELFRALAVFSPESNMSLAKNLLSEVYSS